AISFRCQANRVSGVTIVATSASSLRPNLLAFAASRRRWSSSNRMRRRLSAARSGAPHTVVHNTHFHTVGAIGQGERHVRSRREAPSSGFAWLVLPVDNIAFERCQHAAWNGHSTLLELRLLNIDFDRGH